jgi:hypothetical protein
MSGHPPNPVQCAVSHASWSSAIALCESSPGKSRDCSGRELRRQESPRGPIEHTGANHLPLPSQVDLEREDLDPLQINHLLIQPVALQLSSDFLAAVARVEDAPDAAPQGDARPAQHKARARPPREPRAACSHAQPAYAQRMGGRVECDPTRRALRFGRRSPTSRGSGASRCARASTASRLFSSSVPLKNFPEQRPRSVESLSPNRLASLAVSSLRPRPLLPPHASFK